MGKTVLILGNGFDLAHGLPTRYSDFLKFCKITELLHKSHDNCKEIEILNFNDCLEYINNSKVHFKIKKIFSKIFDEKIDIFLEINRYSKIEYLLINKIYFYIEDNIWFQYFWNIYSDGNNQNLGENWIDFEGEIEKIIQILDRKTDEMDLSFYEIFEEGNRSTFKANDNIDNFEIFKEIINCNNFYQISINELVNRLYKDLNNLIFALEIYLSDFVNKMNISSISPDIKGINPDFIINFNYTNTYKRLYSDNSSQNLYYIHGFCRDLQYRDNVEDNNMVLGCGEYSNDYETKYADSFDLFKKYIQRIEKDTLMKNDEYFDIIKSDYEIHNETAQVFIFGHSLGEIDSDILQDYIDNPATKLTVFCKDKNAISTYRKKIRNMVTGDFYKMVNVRPRKIIFKVQEPFEKLEKKLSTSGAAK